MELAQHALNTRDQALTEECVLLTLAMIDNTSRLTVPAKIAMTTLDNRVMEEFVDPISVDSDKDLSFLVDVPIVVTSQEDSQTQFPKRTIESVDQTPVWVTRFSLLTEPVVIANHLRELM